MNRAPGHRNAGYQLFEKRTNVIARNQATAARIHDRSGRLLIRHRRKDRSAMHYAISDAELLFSALRLHDDCRGVGFSTVLSRRRHQRCQPDHDVQRLGHDMRRAVVVRGLQSIARLPRHLTAKQIIAESAKNAEIIEVLRGLGVDYAQSHGVSQPQKLQRAAIA
jgi:hypothetical protein